MLVSGRVFNGFYGQSIYPKGFIFGGILQEWRKESGVELRGTFARILPLRGRFVHIPKKQEKEQHRLKSAGLKGDLLVSSQEGNQAINGPNNVVTLTKTNSTSP